MKPLTIFLLWICLALMPWQPSGRASYYYAGGIPTGSVFSHRAGSPVLDPGTVNGSYPAGSVGDLLITLYGWENTGTVTSMTASFDGAMTLTASDVGTAVNTIIGYVICSNTSAGIITLTISGAHDFQDWVICRVTATGTITVGTPVKGHGTGTSVSIGTYTTATQNGLLLAMIKPDNTCTFSSEAFGGVSATEHDLAGTATSAFSLLHTSAQSGASFTATISTSLNWSAIAVSVTAQ